MMQWMVIYRVGLAEGKQTRVARVMAYFHPSGKAEKRSHFFKPLVFVLCREADRFRVDHTAKVIVYMFREIIRIHRLDCLKPLETEFHLIRA